MIYVQTFPLWLGCNVITTVPRLALIIILPCLACTERMCDLRLQQNHKMAAHDDEIIDHHQSSDLKASR
jgi:hypothetical protein